MAGLTDLPLAELRSRRLDAEQEEADLSFLRRMLHGRIDIVRAEQRHRAPGFKGGSVIDELTEILTDVQRTTRGLGRHMSVEPSRVDEHRRVAEQLVGDSVVSDVAARSDDELAAALEALRAHENEVSEVRRQVQDVVDELSGELTRRYREGAATVDELLVDRSGH
jgi:hypothetical protein